MSAHGEEPGTAPPGAADAGSGWGCLRSWPASAAAENAESQVDMPSPFRLLRYALLAALALAVMAPSPAAAGDRTVVRTDKMRAAEARILKDINRIRVHNGRRPLRLDRRTRSVARARSSDMAAKRYFAHVEPDGDNAKRILSRRHIGASEVTENIGHTIGLTLRQGTKRMANWWYHSPPHRRQMLARDINYVGIGIARRGGRFTYTAIFTRSRDKTSPKVVIDETTWRPSGAGAQVTIDWHGIDPRLATGTAGVKRFEVQRSTPLEGWRGVDGKSRISKRSLSTYGTGVQRFRVRAIDRAGNVGPWAYTRVAVTSPLRSWF